MAGFNYAFCKNSAQPNWSEAPWMTSLQFDWQNLRPVWMFSASGSSQCSHDLQQLCPEFAVSVRTVAFLSSSPSGCSLVPSHPPKTCTLMEMDGWLQPYQEKKTPKKTKMNFHATFKALSHSHSTSEPLGKVSGTQERLFSFVKHFSFCFCSCREPVTKSHEPAGKERCTAPSQHTIMR